MRVLLPCASFASSSKISHGSSLLSSSKALGAQREKKKSAVQKEIDGWDQILARKWRFFIVTTYPSFKINSDATKNILLLFIKTGTVTNLPPLRESRPEIPGSSDARKE